MAYRWKVTVQTPLEKNNKPVVIRHANLRAAILGIGVRREFRVFSADDIAEAIEIGTVLWGSIAQKRADNHVSFTTPDGGLIVSIDRLTNFYEYHIVSTYNGRRKPEASTYHHHNKRGIMLDARATFLAQLEAMGHSDIRIKSFHQLGDDK